jgi:hypothetical protein
MFLVVFSEQLHVEGTSDSWELEASCNFPTFESLLYLFLENNQFVLHLRVNVPLLVAGPKSPKSITNDIAEACLFLSKYVLPQLCEDILPLLQLLSNFLVLSSLPLVLHRVCLFHSVRYWRHHHLGVWHGILKDKLLHSTLILQSPLLIVLPSTVLWWFLRSGGHRLCLLIGRLLLLSRVIDLSTSAPMTLPRRLTLGLRNLSRVFSYGSFQLGVRVTSFVRRSLLTLCILLVYLLQINMLMSILLLFWRFSSTSRVVAVVVSEASWINKRF